MFLFLLIFSSQLVNATELLVAMAEKDSQKQIVLLTLPENRLTPLTSGSFWHLYPDIDSSGRWVSYVEGQDNTHLRVAVLDRKSGTVEYRTTPGSYLHTDLSGDGKWLAFSGPDPKNGKSGIARMRNVAGASVEWLPSPEESYFPSLSSDGTLLVYQSNRGIDEKRIRLQDYFADKNQEIPCPTKICMSPSFSFDDRYITFTHKTSDEIWDILIYDRKEQKSVTAVRGTGGNHNFAPTFASDGSLLFASDRSGYFAIYRIEKSQLGTTTPKVLELLNSPQTDFYAPSLSGNVDAIQSEKPQIPQPARSSFGAAKVGDSIYVVGGHQGHEHTYPPESFLSRTEYFDLKEGKWNSAPDRPAAAHGFGVAGHPPYLYAFGGFAYSDAHQPKWKSLSQIDRYDTISRQWVTLGQLPRNRSSNVTVQIGDNVYLIGGWDSTPKFPKDYDGRFLPEIDVFNLKTEQVTTLPVTLPAPLRRAFTGVADGDEIYLIGGIGEGADHFKLLDRLTVFNTKTLSFRELAPLPFETFAPAAAIFNHSLYVFGGMFKLSNDDYRYVNHIFFLSGTEWTHSGRYLSETKGFSQVVPLSSQEVAILGGHHYTDTTDTPVGTFESFIHRNPVPSLLGCPHE